MKKSALVAAVVLTTLVPGSARQADEPLVLKSRRVDVRIRENLALVRFEYTVENPTARPLEGEVAFSAPEGGAVFEVTLAKNVSSKDRVSKLLAASDAVRAFAAIGKEVRQADVARQAQDPSGATGLPSATPGAGVGRTVGPSPLSVYGDPALLELIAGSSYRLRFFPVMPRDDQKATFTTAVEASRTEEGYELRIPLSDSAKFDRRKGAADTLRVTAAGVENLTSKSHELRRGAGGVQEAETGSSEALVLRWTPGAKAKPFAISAEDVPTASDDWGRAVRALRDARGLSKGEPAAVSRENSLLVIDRAELKRLLKLGGR